jgi:hypothetical protein
VEVRMRTWRDKVIDEHLGNPHQERQNEKQRAAQRRERKKMDKRSRKFVSKVRKRK